MTNATIVGTSTGIKTGSTLSVEAYGGTATTLTTSKTILYDNDAGLDISGGEVTQPSTLAEGDKPEHKSAVETSEKKKRVIVRTSGRYIQDGVLTDLGIYVDGGEVIVEVGNLKTTGNAWIPNTNEIVPSVYVKTGKLTILNGRTLTTSKGVTIENGSLLTLAATGNMAQTATIVGDVKFIGNNSNIKLGSAHANETAKYSLLSVSGSVHFLKGTFEPVSQLCKYIQSRSDRSFKSNDFWEYFQHRPNFEWYSTIHHNAVGYSRCFNRLRELG